MRPAALLAVLALAAAPALAGDVVIRIEGTVFAANPAPGSGPFTGAVAGAPATLRLEVFVPGTVIAPGQYESYMIDGPASTLEIGGAVDALSGGSIALQNDFPVADGLRMMGGPLASGGNITFEAGEPTGTMFGSTDITQELGTWSAGIFSSYNFLLTGNGGFVELQPVQVTIELPALGVAYCAPAAANSTGAPATIRAIGSDVLADNDVTLGAAALPQNSFGYFLCSETQATVPMAGGSQGTLCLGGSVGRFSTQVQNSGSAGTFSLAIDLTALPQPNGAVAAQVGETWSFQAWYRDANPTVTSNFSDGVAVTLR